VEEGDGPYLGQSMAMSKDVVHVRIRCPTVAVPDFHGFAALGGHPPSHEETANIKEVHRASSLMRPGHYTSPDEACPLKWSDAGEPEGWLTFSLRDSLD
jgi:hypothetical protein